MHLFFTGWRTLVLPLLGAIQDLILFRLVLAVHIPARHRQADFSGTSWNLASCTPRVLVRLGAVQMAAIPITFLLLLAYDPRL